MKNNKSFTERYFENLRKCILSIIILGPFVGAMNYFLVTESIKAGYFEYMESAIVLTVLFPFGILFAGMVITVNILSRNE